MVFRGTGRSVTVTRIGPGTAGAGAFLAALAWLQATQHTSWYVSQYALGPGWLVWSLGLLGLSVAGTAVGMGLIRDADARRRLAGRVLVLVGLGGAWLVVWRADPGSLPTDTFVGRVHIYGAVAMFVLGWLASVLIASNSSDRRAVAWSGLLTVALLWLLVAFIQQVDAVKWAQRSVVASLAAWLIFLERTQLAASVTTAPSTR